MANYLGIDIDYSRDADLPEQGQVMLTSKGFYKKEHEESPQQTFARAATSYCFGDYKFAQRIYDYASKKWFTFASPVLSNAAEINWCEFSESQFQLASDWLAKNVCPDGMPISCNLVYIGDSKPELVEARKESAWLSMLGAGIGIYCGNRAPDEKSTGVMAHLKGYDADALSYSQTASRRGSIAAYLDVTHPEIIPFLEMRVPSGGEANKKCFNLNNAVNLPDSFMEAVIKGESYELIDPKHGGTGRFLDAREVWEKILQVRKETGEPYLMFKDTVNRNLPEQITRPLYEVVQSNLCSEITLMTSKKRLAVCCLSSLNLEYYDEWKDTNIVADLIRLLDNVIEYYIRLAPPELHKAVRSARKERALGLGTLGFHSYLQSKGVAFESGGFGSAAQINNQIYSSIKSRAEEESKRLAKLRGEPDDTKGSGFRNSHLLAVAPNASSSSIVNTSPSIEPWRSNAFNAQGRAGSFLIKNKYLEKLLEEVGHNDEEVWDSIIAHEGSVQHLDFLTEDQKKVFKTATEIDPMWIIEHAAQRTPYICQSQSVNIWVKPDVTAQQMSDIHMKAWKSGVKTLYYCRSEAAAKVVTNDIKQPLNKMDVQVSKYEECLSCSG